MECLEMISRTHDIIEDLRGREVLIAIELV